MSFLKKIMGSIKEQDIESSIDEKGDEPIIKTMKDMLEIYKTYLNENKKNLTAYHFGEWMVANFPNSLIIIRDEIKEIPKASEEEKAG